MRRRFYQSLSVRLSLTYAACCLVSMAAVLLVCYLFLEGSLRRRTDIYLAQEIPEYRSLYASQNALVLEDALEKEALSEGFVQVFFRVLDGSGTVLFGTDTRSWKKIRVDHAALQSALQGKTIFEDYVDDDANFSARVVYGMIAEDRVLQLGESLADNHRLLRQFRQVFTAATLAFVFCSLLAGAYMAQRALAGVQRVTQAAVYITAGAWEHRVPISGNDDEIDELAKAFNTMVERIQVLFRELRDVTDDIAHDLRTPLMRIRGEAEMALRELDRDALDIEHCGSVLEECDQMLHLINTMLEISQTEAGAKPLAWGSVDITAVVEDICELFRPAAEDKSVDFRCDVCVTGAYAGDAGRLKRALANVIDNAIKYTEPGGGVSVTGLEEDGAMKIVIKDSGIGIPTAALKDVFGRFYRVESSRSAPGNGLGLSLARAILRAHGGDIEVASEVGEGTLFTLWIPASH